MSEDIIRLPARATIRDIASVHGEVLAGLAGGAALRIDGSGVEDADITLFQLLVAARRSAEKAGIALSIVLPDDGRIAGLLTLSGLARHLR